MENWERNIRALASKNERLADEIRTRILQRKENSVQVQDIGNGRKVLTVTRDGYTWHLNSRLDPDSASNLYADRYDCKPFYRYFVFGFSDGMAIRKLLEKCDKSNVLVICEPDLEILEKAVLEYDLEELFLDSRVWICTSERWKELADMIASVIEYSYIKLVEFCILPAYDILYPQICEKYTDEVVGRIEWEVLQKGTFEGFNRKISTNALFHLNNMITQRHCIQIKKEIQRMGVDQLPAIIISAGPSLDKNIREVKKAEGKAFIFVVDAALRTVIREGIRPDLVCTVDPNAPERFFETVDKQEFLWTASYWTNPSPIKKYGEKVFYYDHLMAWWDEALQKELGEEIPATRPGGSISIEAFQLARYFGFQTIILIGQDLAFTGGQSHTKGIEGILGDNDAYINGRYVVQVEGIDGTMLETDYQMKYYKQWFEKAIQNECRELKVIDATEGGAKIEGTVIQTLQETIEQECERKIEFHEILQNLPPVFDQEQQKRLYQKAVELEKLKTEFEGHLAAVISMEKELIQRYHKLSSNQIKKRLNEIAKQNDKIDFHPFIGWIALYASKEEFELKESICAKEDMDIPEIMERSIRLMESYQAAIPMFEEDYRSVFKGE